MIKSIHRIKNLLLEADEADKKNSDKSQENSDNAESNKQEKYTQDNDSLDSQVDRFLADYEKNAAEDDGTFNSREFASSVARLVNNAENLLEFHNTVLRRALNFVKQNHDDNAVRETEISLEDDHGLVVGESKEDLNDDNNPPYDIHAGPLE